MVTRRKFVSQLTGLLALITGKLSAHSFTFLDHAWLGQLASPKGTPTPPPPGGLVGQWTFSEGSGNTTADLSGSGNTGTFISAGSYPAFSTDSIGGTSFPCIEISSGGYIAVKNGSILLGLSNWTVSSWIKTSTNQNDGMAFYSERGTSGNDILRQDGMCNNCGLQNVPAVTYRNDANNLVQSGATVTVNDGAWHHYVITFDGSNFIIYIDGTAVKTASWPYGGTFTDHVASLIGNDIADLSGNHSGVVGSMADVRLYNGTLTSSDVSGIYAALPQAGTLPTPPTPNLLGRWTFNEGSGATTADLSGNGNTGVLSISSGFPAFSTDSISGNSFPCMEFENGGYITVKSGAIIGGRTNWTISSWINTTGSGSGNDGSSFYCERGISGNDIVKQDGLSGTGGFPNNPAVTYRDDAGNLLSFHVATAINDGVWHHYVITFNGTAFIIFIDGVAVGATIWLHVSSFTDTVVSLIGNDIADLSRANATGKIADMRIYDTALTDAQIAALFAAFPQAT